MSHKFSKKILTAFTAIIVLLVSSPLVFAAEVIPEVNLTPKLFLP